VGGLNNEDNKSVINVVKHIILNKGLEYRDSLAFIEKDIKNNGGNERLHIHVKVLKEILLEHIQLLKELGLEERGNNECKQFD